MYPAAFEYHAPTSVRDALGLLGRLGDDAKLLAGGHSLIPMMKLRLAQPKHVIDLRKVPSERSEARWLTPTPPPTSPRPFSRSASSSSARGRKAGGP